MILERGSQRPFEVSLNLHLAFEQPRPTKRSQVCSSLTRVSDKHQQEEGLPFAVKGLFWKSKGVSAFKSAS